MAAPKEHYLPRRVNVCSSAQDVLPAAMADPEAALHARSGQNNANFTVPITPWDPNSRQQLETAALTAGARRAHLPINPLTHIGITDRVPIWQNPYTDAEDISGPCSSAVSIYQVQPHQPGYLVRASNDSTDGTMAQQRYYYQPPYWSRESGPYGGPYTPLDKSTALMHPPATCPEDLGIDSNFAVDLSSGDYELAVLGSEPWARGEAWTGASPGFADAAGYLTAPAPAYELAGGPPHKETLRSRGNYRRVAREDQCLPGIGCGLGSTWIDPRFEPGPPRMCCGATGDDVVTADAVYAHGGHAGGPTFGALTPAAFQPGGSWNRYVRGFGDGHLVAPTAGRDY